MNNIEEFIKGIKFVHLQPDVLPTSETCSDYENTQFMEDDDIIKARIRPLYRMSKFCTLAVAGIINRTVQFMDNNLTYVNVGTWQGFSLFSGMMGNPEKVCIGVDNFSDVVGGKQEFLNNWNLFATPVSRYHIQDFVEYFKEVHKEPIGLYYYDGDHNYDGQYNGLVLAEPFFADGCIILVDDVNWHAPDEATKKFMQERSGKYEVIFDVRTAQNQHPTFWNGLTVFRKKG